MRSWFGGHARTGSTASPAELEDPQTLETALAGSSPSKPSVIGPDDVSCQSYHE